MSRRRLLLVAIPAVLILVGAGAWVLWPRPGITRANAAQVVEGMTLAEVEAIMGGSPRDESTGPLCVDEPADPTWDGTGICAANRPTWTSNQVLVEIDLDANRQVERARWYPVRRAPESLLDIVRRWLRL